MRARACVRRVPTEEQFRTKAALSAWISRGQTSACFPAPPRPDLTQDPSRSSSFMDTCQAKRAIMDLIAGKMKTHYRLHLFLYVYNHPTLLIALPDRYHKADFTFPIEIPHTKTKDKRKAPLFPNAIRSRFRSRVSISGI